MYNTRQWKRGAIGRALIARVAGELDQAADANPPPEGTLVALMRYAQAQHDLPVDGLGEPVLLARIREDLGMEAHACAATLAAAAHNTAHWHAGNLDRDMIDMLVDELTHALAAEPPAEHVLAALAWFFQDQHGLRCDGLIGPNTYQRMQQVHAPEPAPPADDASPSHGEIAGPGQMLDFEPFVGPLGTRLPQTSKEVFEVSGFKGHRGKDDKIQADPAWKKANIVTCHARGDCEPLPGVPGRLYVSVHRLMEPYLREALRRVQIACPGFEIQRLGGFVVRHMRHDPQRPLSLHATGFAFDINPRQNRAKYFKRGQGPALWTAAYWQHWPHHLPRSVVHAFTSVGFAWGGDWNLNGTTLDQSFFDPMHFQLGGIRVR